MNKFTISEEQFLNLIQENQQLEEDSQNNYPLTTELVNKNPQLKQHLDENILVWVEQKPYIMTVTEYTYWDEYLKLINTGEYRCIFLPLVEIESK